MNSSIFKTFSIDRDQVHWEDSLYELTPVEQIGSVFFKREDFFAPIGYGGINGAKLRQAIWLMVQESQILRENKILLSATSVKSPQTCFPGDEEILLFNKKRITFEEAFKKGEKISVETVVDNRIKKTLIDPPFVTKEIDELVEIDLENGKSFRTTPEHKILTSRGWVEAQFLTKEDEVINYDIPRRV